MTLLTKVTLVGLGTIAVAFACAVWLGSRLQQRALSQLVEPLLRVSSSDSAARVDLNNLNDLPPPVAATSAAWRPCALSSDRIEDVSSPVASLNTTPVGWVSNTPSRTQQ